MNKHAKDIRASIAGKFPFAPRILTASFAYIFFLIALCAGETRTAASAVADEPSPILVKAAFIYNFSVFVDWPEKSFSSPSDVITVCVVGDDKMADALDHTLKGRTAKGRLFVVKYSKWASGLDGCKMAFVDFNLVSNPEKVAREFSASGALVVADSPGAAERGAVINFFTESNRIRFEVNLTAARKGNFFISSRMLQLARIIGPEGGGE